MQLPGRARARVVLIAIISTLPGGAARGESGDRPPYDAPPRGSGLPGLGRLAAIGRPVLRLVWFDVLNAAPSSYEALAREVESLFEAAGLEVSWRRADPGTVTEGAEIQVVLLLEPPRGSSLAPGVMGATPKDHSQAVWIYLERVLAAVGLPRAGSPRSPAQEAVLACALGRVVAHEVIHAVAPDSPHTEAGLMSQRVDRSVLLNPGVAFDVGTVRALRVALTTADVRAGSDAPGRAAMAYGKGVPRK